jgi:hypothetical protein
MCYPPELEVTMTTVPRHKNVQRTTEKVYNHTYTFRRADILKALRLPETAVLKFGGREWEQPFDEDGVLTANVTAPARKRGENGAPEATT